MRQFLNYQTNTWPDVSNLLPLQNFPRLGLAVPVIDLGRMFLLTPRYLH